MYIHEHGLTILLEEKPEDVMTEASIREFAREYILIKNEIDGCVDEEVITEILGAVLYVGAKVAGAAAKATVGAAKMAYKGAKAVGKAAYKGAKAVGKATMKGAKAVGQGAMNVAKGAANVAGDVAADVKGVGKAAMKAAGGVVGDVGQAVGGTFADDSGEVPKQAASAMTDTASSMEDMSQVADSVQSDFESTVQAIPDPAVKDAVVSAGESAMTNLQGAVNGQLSTIQAQIADEYKKAKGEDMDPNALRQQAVIALGASVAKVVKDLSS